MLEWDPWEMRNQKGIFVGLANIMIVHHIHFTNST